MAAFSIIGLLQLLNPFFVLAYIPVIAIDSWIVAILFMISIFITIGYWTINFHRLGVLSFIPMLAWIGAIIAWLVPAIGPVLSAMISAFPWIPLAEIMHWWVYET
jgi:hypothetical protein